MAMWGHRANTVIGRAIGLPGEAVREAQRVLGVVLPAALAELLRIQNGGGVVPAASFGDSG